MSIRRRQKPLLGTFVEIAAMGETNFADNAITKAFETINEVQRLASFQDGTSELSRLNIGGAFISINPLLKRMLRLARAMTNRSNGLFNCTLGGALIHQNILPDHGGPSAAACGTANDIEFRGAHVILHNRVRITLDGIAKGFAVDLAVQTLKHHGIESGFVNAGGDVRAFGMSLPIAIRAFDGGLLQAGSLRDTAIATSRVGDLPDERFPGVILSASGHAPQSGVWSVVAAQAWRADALTKVAALAPANERDRLIRSLKGSLLPQPVAQVA
nr:MAG: FAD:protein FMN transferase [Hyphomicrobiales bacterium]